MDLIQLILDEAVRVEPVRCDQCGHLTEWVHFGDCGMVCADCCMTRPEWAVETLNVAGRPSRASAGSRSDCSACPTARLAWTPP